VYNFGNFAEALAMPRKFQNISITFAKDAQCIGEQSKYLTTSISDDGQLITERIFQIGSEICKKISKDPDEVQALSHCDEISQENVKCLGKILNSRSDKLNQKSCVFVSFDENKLRIVQLDVSRLTPSVQIFPGQVCVIGGNNPRGKMFYVTELYSERILENYPFPSQRDLTEPISIVIASGPFTSGENLLFEHLDKLIENCQNNKPNILILTGTFFNAKTKLIFDLAAEIDEHFTKMLESVSERLGSDTKIIIVPSCDDINSSSCYPTRAYKLKKTLAAFANIFLATDPCTLDINGIKIAMTSTDITRHLEESEFCV
jgi:DNA polymerase alpha subunit B